MKNAILAIVLAALWVVAGTIDYYWQLPPAP
jgi:hypothetical protein